MAQIFKAKTLVANTGKFAYEVSGPNLVYNTGNQNIDGSKNFYIRPTVNGTGVLLSGEATSLPSTIVYTTGNQTISGTKTFIQDTVFGDSAQGDFLVISGNTFTIYGSGNFTSGLFVNGNPVLTGIDLSSYATSANLFITGSTLNNKINSLSGYVNFQDVIFSGQIALSGSRLDNKINSLSGLFTSYTGSLDTTFATDAQLFNTGSTLDNKINSLSGYVNSQDNIFSGQIFNTGSRLDNKINSISGYINSQDILFSGQISLTGSNLNDKINSLSGLFTTYTGSLDATFATDLQLFNTGSTLDAKINSLSGYVNSQDNIFSGQISSTGSSLDFSKENHIIEDRSFILNGFIMNSLPEGRNVRYSISFDGATTNYNLTLPSVGQTGDKFYLSLTTPSNTNLNINRVIPGPPGFTLIEAVAAGTIFNKGYYINQIFDGTTIPNYISMDNLMGFASIINLNLSGSILNNKINSLSGYINSQDIIFSGQTFNTGSRLDNKINSLSGWSASSANLFATGSALYNSIVSLSGLFTGYTGSLDANFATDAQLFTTGSSLDNKINSLSGYVNSQDNIFSGQIFNTGSILDSKINSLSGYVNSQDIIFSGQTFSTGSRLDNKINSLSGYVDSKDIIFSGQIASTGSNLYNSIISLSGLFTGYTGTLDANFATDAQLFTTGSILDNKINSLSGISVLTSGNQTINGIKTFNSGIIFPNSANGSPINFAQTRAINFQSLGGINSAAIYGTYNGYPKIAVALSQAATPTPSFPLEDLIEIKGNSFGSPALSSVIASNIAITISGNQVLTGVNLSSYATVANLFSTGSILDNKINSLSGAFTSYTGNLDANFATDAQLFTTGSTLDNKINSLSGYVNSQDIIFSGQTFNTGSRLDNKINSLSGYINSQDIVFSGQIFNTGSILDNKINALSGYVTGITGTFGTLPANLYSTGATLDAKINSLSGYVNSQNIIFSGQTSNTGSRLDNKINSLSGYVDSKSITLPSTIVYTTGDQIISGNKTFINNIAVSGTGNFNNVKVSNIDKLFLSGIDIVITGNSSINVYNAIYISGNPVLTGIIPTSQTISNVVYTTGDQIIGGNKTFANQLLFGNQSSTAGFISGNISNDGEVSNLYINGGGGAGVTESYLTISSEYDTLSLGRSHGFGFGNTYFQIDGGGEDLRISNTNVYVYENIYGSKNVYANNLVYNTTNQIISGIKTFDVFPIVSGNKLITGVDLTSYATVSNLFSTGSTLNNKINSLSGYINFQDNVFSGQIFNTGGILDTKINSLSGHVNSQDIIFSGQTFNTGSRLDNKINALSGYVTGITGIFGTLPANLYATGSTLDNKINSLSGYVNSQDNIFSGQTFNTGSRLDNKINSLSGYVNSQDIIFSGQIASSGSSLYNSIIALSGLFTGYTGSLDTNFATDIQLFNTGSVLDNKINSLSGYVNSQDTLFSGQIFNTGSRLDNKINSLSGYVNAQDILFSGQIASTGSNLDNKINLISGFFNNNVVYTTGNQTVLGQKTFSGTTTVIGHFAATSKSFLIDHPLDNNKKLQYASLEGPEHGVFLRGKTNENIINLPNYWSALVNENSISVNLTPINVYSNIYVVDYNNTRIITNGNNGNYYFYTVYGERKDIPKLTVEF